MTGDFTDLPSDMTQYKQAIVWTEPKNGKYRWWHKRMKKYKPVVIDLATGEELDENTTVTMRWDKDGRITIQTKETE